VESNTDIDFRIMMNIITPPEDDPLQFPIELPVQVPLASQQLFSLPILLFYEKNRVMLTQKEVNNLREYLVNYGGFLFVDEPVSVTGIEDGEFLASIKELLRQALPEYPIKKIPCEHEIYHNFYKLAGPPRGHSGKSGDLEGIFIDGRLAVIFSDKSYSTSWAPTIFDPKLRYIPEVYKFGINMLVYAVTHGKISDYSGYTNGSK